MKPPVETIRISAEAREKLIQLKRLTGIQHWNVLCRWGLCLSMQNSRHYCERKLGEKSNIEMSWGTFAGEQSDVLIAIVNYGWNRAIIDKPSLTCGEYFQTSLEYGISILPKALQGNGSNHLCGLLNSDISTAN